MITCSILRPFKTENKLRPVQTPSFISDIYNTSTMKNLDLHHQPINLKSEPISINFRAPKPSPFTMNLYGLNAGGLCKSPPRALELPL